MLAEIKIVGISTPVNVEDFQVVRSLDKSPVARFEDVPDLEHYQFDSAHYYVFSGKSVLHVSGDKIEYVLIRK